MRLVAPGGSKSTVASGVTRTHPGAQRRVLLDVLVTRRRSSRPRRVVHLRPRVASAVRGVHRAVGLAGAEHRVNFINEEDDARRGAAFTSASTDFNLSSNSPLYFAPARARRGPASAGRRLGGAAGHVVLDDAQSQPRRWPSCRRPARPRGGDFSCPRRDLNRRRISSSLTTGSILPSAAAATGRSRASPRHRTTTRRARCRPCGRSASSSSRAMLRRRPGRPSLSVVEERQRKRVLGYEVSPASRRSSRRSPAPCANRWTVMPRAAAATTPAARRRPRPSGRAARPRRRRLPASDGRSRRLRIVSPRRGLARRRVLCSSRVYGGVERFRGGFGEVVCSHCLCVSARSQIFCCERTCVCSECPPLQCCWSCNASACSYSNAAMRCVAQQLAMLCEPRYEL